MAVYKNHAKCRNPDCDRITRANGLCLRCYQREWKQRKKEEARELQHA